MTAEEKAILKRVLEDQLKEASANMSSKSYGKVEISEPEPDPLDRAVVDTEQFFTLRFKERNKQLIRKIRKAIDNIEDDSHGICELCEEDIPIRRLIVQPFATHCVQCQNNIEYIQNTSFSPVSFTYCKSMLK